MNYEDAQPMDAEAELLQRNRRVADAVGMLVAPIGYEVVPKRSRQAALDRAWDALRCGKVGVAEGWMQLAREMSHG